MSQAELTDSEVSDLCHSVLEMESRPRVARAPEGGDNHVWFVDNNLVIRVASDSEISKRQSREIGLRQLLRKHVKDPDIIPECVASGRWSEKGVSYCIESRIYGSSLEIVSASSQTEADLILFLSSLRTIPLDSPEIVNLPIEDDLDFEELERSAKTAWKRLLRNGQLQANETVGDVLNLPNIGLFAESHAHPPVLLHADLKGEHILVDTSNGAVVGILDWTDARIGDPAIDIAGLAISVGSAMAARVGLGVGYSKSVIARAIYLARCDAFDFLDERLNGDDDSPIELLKIQLKRATEFFDL